MAITRLDVGATDADTVYVMVSPSFTRVLSVEIAMTGNATRGWNPVPDVDGRAGVTVKATVLARPTL